MVPRSLAIVVASFFQMGLAAAADGPPPHPGEKSPCPQDGDPGERAHDGFFARSEPGLAFFWANVSGSSAPQRRTGIRGLGQSGALSLGGTPMPGLVVGGTVWTARIDPVFVEGGKTVSPDDDSVKVTQLRVGPFIDWYPQPKRGFHTTVAAALVVQLESDVKGEPVEPEAYGASLALGSGYEWFVAKEFSLGFSGRFAFGAVARTAAGRSESTLFIVPELAITATYH